jgi:uncharacterized membrane protein
LSEGVEWVGLGSHKVGPGWRSWLNLGWDLGNSNWGLALAILLVVVVVLVLVVLFGVLGRLEHQSASMVSLIFLSIFCVDLFNGSDSLLTLNGLGNFRVLES